MASTWIDVADSAVKIGLGAVIAAIVATIVPLITFAKEAYTDRRSRRLKLLEESVILFNAYCSDAMAYSAAITDGIIFQLKGKKDEFVIKRYKKARDQIDEVGSKVNKAIAFLELLGQHDLASRIRRLGKLHEEARKAIIASSKPESAQELFDDLKKDTKALSTEIHSEFGKVYELEPEIKRMLLLEGPII